MKTKIAKVIMFLFSLVFATTITGVVSKSLDNIHTENFIFILIYFLVVCILIDVFFINKVLTNDLLAQFVIRIIILLIMTIAISYPTLRNDISVKTTLTLSYHNNSSDLVDSDKIWISDIFIDGKSVKLNKFNLPNGWKYIEQWDDIILCDVKPEDLVLKFPASKEIKVRFVYYDNFVNYTELTDGNEVIQNIIFEEYKQNEYYIYKVKSNLQNRNLYQTILLLISFIFLSSIISALSLNFCKKKEINIKKVSQLISETFSDKVLYYVLSIEILLLLNVNNLDVLSKLILSILSILAGCVISKRINFKTKPIKLLYMILIFISTFLWCGHAIFMKGSRVELSFINILLFLLSSFWIEPIIRLVYLGILKLRNNNSSVVTKNKKRFLFLFFILFIIWEGMLIIFYPGSIAPDAVWQWEQCKGVAAYGLENPLAHTLWMKLILYFTNSLFVMTTIQIIIISLIYSYLFYWILGNIKNQKIIYFIAFLFALNPPNWLAAITIVRDTLFTACLVLLLFCFYRIVNEKNKFFNLSRSMLFIISFSITILFRRNAILVFYIGVIFFIYYIIKSKLVYGILPLLVVITNVLAFNEVIPKLMDIDAKNTSATQYSSILSGLGAVAASGVTMDKKTYDMLTSQVSYSWWQDNYNKYNIDIYSFESENAGLSNKIEGYSGSEVVGAYIRNLFQYPDIIIKARLDGMDILWDCIQPEDSFNSRFADGIWYGERDYTNSVGYMPNHGNTYLKDSKIAKIIRENVWKINECKLLDSIIWRGGLYFILFFILIFDWIVEKNKRVISVLIPFLSYTLSWILMLNHQSFRYIYYVSICVLFMTMFTIQNNYKLKS